MKAPIVVVLTLTLGLVAGCGTSVSEPVGIPKSEQAPVVQPNVSVPPVVSELEATISYVHRYVTYEVKRGLKQFGDVHIANSVVALPPSAPNRIRISFEVPHDLEPDSLLMNASYGCGHTNQSDLELRTATDEVGAYIDSGKLFFSSEAEGIQDAFRRCRSDRITVGIDLFNYNLVFEQSIQVHLFQEPNPPQGSGKDTQ